MTTLHDVPHDPARVPDGARLRRLTTGIQGARQGRGLGALVLDLWEAVFTAGVLVAVTVGVTQAARELVTAAPGAPPSTGTVLDGEAAVLCALLAAAGGVLGLSARLGPVAVVGGAATWWLPLPVDRRGLLRPAVLRGPLLGAGAGLLVTTTAAVLLGTGLPAEAVVRWAVAGGATGAGAVAVAAVAQLRGVPRRRVALAGDVVLAVAAVAAAALALGVGGAGGGSTGPPGALAPAWAVSGAVALAAAAATLVVERSADAVPGDSLRATGSVVGRGQAALLGLDLRELVRALDVGRGRATYRSRRLLPGGPRRAVVAADLVVLARSPRLLVQAGVAALLGVAAAHVPLVGAGVPLWVALGATGFWAANATAAGARHADAVPALDRTLPLSAAQVRRVRAVVPLLAALVWVAVVLGAQAARTGEVGWLLVAPSWALVLAAGALRSAFRPVPTYRFAAVATPMGGVPQLGTTLHGVDLVLLATVPTAAALHLGVVAPALVAVQALAAVGAIAFATTPRGEATSAPAPEQRATTAP